MRILHNKWEIEWRRWGFALVLVSLFLTAMPIQAENHILAEKISIEEAFTLIGIEYGVHFNYDRAVVADVEVDYESGQFEKMEEALQSVFSQTNLKYEVFDQRYVAVYRQDREGVESMKKMVSHFQEVISSSEEAYHRSERRITPPLAPLFIKDIYSKRIVFSVSGTVTDQDGEPLIGVNIQVKGTNKGTSTDFDGNFNLNDIDENAILVVSYVGYQTQEVSIDGRSELEIVMASDAQLLDEVVVVGYGTQRKKLITGATSQVGVDQISRQNSVSVIDALKSSTSGVQITKTSGQPGSDFQINIRGLGTTGDATPLFIVDGVPVSDINYLNPSDIESIDILKDAASSSIYGSRAANGVVLVTTKSGDYGVKYSISYEGYYGVQNLYKKPSTLNAKEYAAMMNEARLNDGLPPYDFESLVPNWSEIESGNWQGTDWFDEILATNVPIQNHAVNINGGSDKSHYSMGLSFTDQDGILGRPVASTYKRYNFRLNTEHKIIANDDFTILKIGEDLTYSYIDRSGIAVGGMYTNSIRNTLATSPFMSVLDEEGEYQYAIPWDIRVPNPVAIMDYTHGNNTSIANKLLGNVNLNFRPIKNLVFRSMIGFDFSNGSYRDYTPRYNLSDRHFRDYSSTSHNLSKTLGYNIESTVDYSFPIGDSRNQLDLLIGNTIQKSGIGEIIYGTNTNSIFNDLKHAYLDNSKSIDPARTVVGSYPWGEDKLMSFFGRINYDFSEKYLLTLVMRTDGSSKFAKGKRWGYFPSISAGWIISEEEFWQDLLNTISFFKLRASWGQNGNQNISSFQYLSTISLTGADYYGIDKTEKLIGAYPNILPNPDVTWETSEQINIGFDSYLFGDRLFLNFDWYNKMTKDWLVAAPTLASFGTGAPFINGGDVRNRGFEVGLTWNNEFKNLNYEVGLNLSHNKNEVTRIANFEKIIHGPVGVLADLTSEIYRAEEGYPIGYFWGYRTNGIFQNEQEVKDYVNSKGEMIQPDATPGDVRFVNMNDDDRIDDKDKVMIGNPNPDFTFGINFFGEYKGLSFSLIANGVLGNQIIRSYRDFAIFPTHNFTTEIFDRWHGENTSDRIPKLSTASSENFSNISDLYIENGDYLRISTFTIGYDFDRLFQSGFFQKLQLNFSIQNLYTVTKYSGMDPEIGYSGGTSFGSGIDLGFYPSPRTILFGLSMNI